MVYLRPEVLRAMKLHAVETDRSVSDVFAEAARDHLASRGVAVPPAPMPAAPRDGATRTTVEHLVEAIDRQGSRIEEALRGVEDQGAVAWRRNEAARPAGTKAADAMKALLGLLREAGPAGLSSGDLSAAMHGAGVTSGAAETAKAVLHGAGLVRREGRRWLVEGA